MTKPTDSLDTLCNAAGIKRADMLDIWAEVKANHTRLDSCTRHDFPEPPAGVLGAKLTCANCGGTMGSSEVRWYQLGLKHGDV